MKIKILKGCRAGGKRLKVGKDYSTPSDLTEKDAKMLVAFGQAEVEGKKPAPVPGTLTTGKMK